MLLMRPFVHLAFLSLLVLAPRTQDNAPIVLTGARVLDAAGERFLDDHAVLVRDGRIVAIARSAELPAPAGARTVDLSGRWLVPGLIDLHVHLLLRPYDQMSWNDQVLTESLELRTIRATVAARTTLLAGFTTIRELGTEGALMVEYGMAPAQALRAATAVAARVLGRADDLGRIAPGCVADLVALARDPLQDPAALREPTLVMAAGRIVVP
jgi:imidazolonepropionase-like amidohydrolase